MWNYCHLVSGGNGRKIGSQMKHSRVNVRVCNKLYMQGFKPPFTQWHGGLFHLTQHNIMDMCLCVHWPLWRGNVLALQHL